MEKAKTNINLGKSGAGKSYILGYDIERFYQDGFFPVVLDKKNDHGPDPSKSYSQDNPKNKGLGPELGFSRIELSAAEMEQITKDFWIEMLDGLMKDGTPGIRITFERGDPDVQQNFVQFGNKLSNAILQLRGKVYFAVEEIRNFAPSQSNKSDFAALQTVITEGRSMNTGFGATTQFPQQVHFEIYNACNIYRVFYLGQKMENYKKLVSDRSQIKEMMRWSAEDRNYLYINDNTGDMEVRNSKGIGRRTNHVG